MTYFLVHADGKRDEVSRERAIELVSGCYTEKVCTYEELLESVIGFGLRLGAGCFLEVSR